MSRTKQLLVLVVVVSASALGCAAQQAMFAGPVKLKSEAPPGIVLEGQDKRPVECYAYAGDSLSDVKTGQWAVVEGEPSHPGDLAVGIRDCRVIAVSAGEVSGDTPGMALRRRVQEARPPKSAEVESKSGK